MSSNALESQGMVLKLDISSVMTTIPDIKDLSFRTGSAAVIDVTDLSSTAKEKRMGLQDEGQCTFTLMFQPKNAVHAALVAAKASRALQDFQVVMTDTAPATTYDFSGYVLSVPISGSVDGVIESNVTIEISGPVTLA